MSAPVESRGTLPESWRVQLPVFEGPLDLLLHLVRVNQVEIADIPVAKVCDQFHEYLSLMEELNLDIAAEYIFEAAQLIHLKSRLLLPSRRREDGEEEDPRQELVERLLEYRRLKEAAQSLAEIDGIRHGIWTRPPEKLPSPDAATVDLGEVSLFDLLSAFHEVIGRYEREHPEPLHLKREDFRVRDQLERLLERLAEDRPYDLLEDLRSRSCRRDRALPNRARDPVARARGDPGMSGDPEIAATVEAVLFAATEPVPLDKLCELFPDGRRQQVEEALAEVRARYGDEPGRGVKLEEVAGGLRLVTRPEQHGALRRYFEISGRSRLSMAALETLAIVAYRQPVTGPEIQELRGVNSAGVLRTLLERRLLRVAGRKPVVGKPFLYKTTREFLMHFGLQSLDDLPPLEEFEELVGEAGEGGEAAS